MPCICDTWAREYAPSEPREPHHKFCPQYSPNAAEENPFIRDCPRCKTAGEQCRLCGAILGEVVASEPFPLERESDNNWHVDPEGQ